MRRRHDILLQAEDPSAQQRRAADPVLNVWVGASAGTGKTKVLTDRVLRLLLPRADGRPGSPPHRILCLTYTKAAAGEMRNRIAMRLGGWASMPQAALLDELQDLMGRPALDAEIEAARRLFATVTDAPGGLRLMTIHSFCQSLLARFPLEAGLSPHFTVLEEAESHRLLTEARDAVLAMAQARPDTAEGEALRRLAAEQNEEQFDALLRSLTGERHQLEAFLRQEGLEDGAYAALCGALSIAPDDTPERVVRDACADHAFDARGLRQALTALLDAGGANNAKLAAPLQRFLETPASSRDPMPLLRALTTAGEEGGLRPKAVSQLGTKAASALFPACAEVLTVEADRLIAMREHLTLCRGARLTHCLVILGQAIAGFYQQAKTRSGALDFEDLIHHSRVLLQSGMAGWILYKLDGGLDHLLIDEAQDTNQAQWDIAEALVEEFFAGVGARDTARTVFVVGDEKQSIYSFQRADPFIFASKRAEFEARAKAAGLGWLSVPLRTSFRSGPSVLDFVDAVFEDPEARQGLGDMVIEHLSERHGDAALVELWPVFRVATSDKADPWHAPAAPEPAQDAAALLADEIADTVAGWLAQGEVLASRNRPVEAGDVLVLVRRRSAFVTQLIRALKARDVPVTGIDRMVLTEQLAVQDLLAAAQAALLPEDSLTLACVLKSPLVRYDDAQLERLCLNRPRGRTLWSVLQADMDCREVVAWLRDLIRLAGSERPYEFFSRVLHTPCPGDPVSGLRAMAGRLGGEALDPLNELLQQALGFERNQIAQLQHFLQAQAVSATELKREQEEAGGAVRIMTVHAAKGLQAPIVFLPDTTSIVKPRSGGGRLLWPDKTRLAVPLWSPRKKDDHAVYRGALGLAHDREMQEYRRLLYVAMTRAADRLYICGAQGRASLPDDCWYALMRRAFAGFADVETVEAQAPAGLDLQDQPYRKLRLGNPQARLVPVRPAQMPAAVDAPDMPGWVHAAPPVEPAPARPYAPSAPLEAGPPARSPLQAEDGHRFRRGLLTHKLLQVLPDIADAARDDAAARFVGRQAPDLPPEMQAGIVAETLAVLRHPAFAPLFGPGSLAEVPLSGNVDGRLVSGQIDRLLVTDDAVWIVDFKTNRPPPATPDAVAPAYRRQLQAYAGTLRLIYPGRTLRGFLLWTDGPDLMAIDLDDPSGAAR